MQMQFNLLENGEFSKVFQMEDTKMFIHQRLDEESETYYLLCAIPEMIVNGSTLQDVHLPMPFQSKEEMESVFQEFQDSHANNLFAMILAQIVSNESNSNQDIEQPENN